MDTMTSRTLKLLGLLLILLLFSLNTLANNIDDKKELTELQKLKAENHQLKIENATCKVTLADRESQLFQVQKSKELSDEEKKLEKEFRLQLKAKDEDEFDWKTLTFKPKSSGTPK